MGVEHVFDYGKPGWSGKALEVMSSQGVQMFLESTGDRQPRLPVTVTIRAMDHLRRPPQPPPSQRARIDGFLDAEMMGIEIRPSREETMDAVGLDASAALYERSPLEAELQTTFFLPGYVWYAPANAVRMFVNERSPMLLAAQKINH